MPDGGFKGESPTHQGKWAKPTLEKEEHGIPV
jgi:hypothetical protein